MGDLLGFAGGAIILFIAGALAYVCVSGALRGMMADYIRNYWIYFPLAVFFSVVTFRASMFILDLISIYLLSNLSDVVAFD